MTNEEIGPVRQVLTIGGSWLLLIVAGLFIIGWVELVMRAHAWYMDRFAPESSEVHPSVILGELVNALLVAMEHVIAHTDMYFYVGLTLVATGFALRVALYRRPVAGAAALGLAGVGIVVAFVPLFADFALRSIAGVVIGNLWLAGLSAAVFTLVAVITGLFIRSLVMWALDDLDRRPWTREEET